MDDIWQDAEQAIFDVFGYPTTQLPADAIRQLGRRINQLETEAARSAGGLAAPGPRRDGPAAGIAFEDFVSWAVRDGLDVIISAKSEDGGVIRISPATDGTFLPRVRIVAGETDSVVELIRRAAEQATAGHGLESQWLLGNLKADEARGVVKSDPDWVFGPSISPYDPISVLAKFLAEVFTQWDAGYPAEQFELELRRAS